MFEETRLFQCLSELFPAKIEIQNSNLADAVMVEFLGIVFCFADKFDIEILASGLQSFLSNFQRNFMEISSSSTTNQIIVVLQRDRNLPFRIVRVVELTRIYRSSVATTVT